MRKLIGGVAGVLCLVVLGQVMADDKKAPPGTSPADNKKASSGTDTAPWFDADRFVKDHDKNNDGKLSKDELPADLQQHLAQIDTNKDGFITADELRQHAELMARQRPEVVEILYYVIDVPEEETASIQELQQAYDLLRKLDKDGNGKLDPQEVKAYRQTRAEERITGIFKALDRNGDGKIAKDEARGFWADDFSQLDKNGDGFLDRQEVENAFHLNRTTGAAGSAGKPGK